MPKKRTYQFSVEAVEDLQALHRFLVSQNEEAVFPVLYSRIEACISLICEFPEMAVYNKSLSVREITVPKTRYKIFFEERAGIIQIHRIYHTSRKWPDDSKQ